MSRFRMLQDDEIQQLIQQGCSARHWKNVTVTDGFNAARVRNVHFDGDVRIGRLAGDLTDCHGLPKTSGIFNAIIVNASIGNDCRIANVGVHLANYNIGNNVCIENVGCLHTCPDATFGNGIEIDVLNEGGGREVTLFAQMSAQYAYLACLHRYRPALVKKLHAIANQYTQHAKADRGNIDDNACICSAREIIDLNVGPHARIDGAATLRNGTILSTPDDPTFIGPDVKAQDFIVAEGASVSDGALLAKVFVGQACQIGKQYSAENSLFFANCEAFHGEAVSVFAGPYSVTHHKSTLLIAALFSFYNAGSGSNQSNHMYKLGPVHEGKLARGVKTGSFSYMMWPCRIGPFSVVLGKHSGTLDLADHVFSHIEARADGKAALVPGLNITTVGTVRDGAKWRTRDRRKAAVKRDLISFDVFSPYTVGKMLRASAQLKQLQDATDKSIEEVALGGAMIRRPILRTGQKNYRTGIEMYLLETAFSRAEKGLNGGRDAMLAALQPDADALYSDQWVDIAGLLMPRQRLAQLHDTIEAGNVDSADALNNALQSIHQAYDKDAWLWVLKAFQQVFGVDLTNASKDDLLNLADKFAKIKGKFYKLVLADAEKEFAELSRSGFGQDAASHDDALLDFEQVRGRYEKNKFVNEMQAKLQELAQRVDALKNVLK